jgi:hypothetical protein
VVGGPVVVVWHVVGLSAMVGSYMVGSAVAESSTIVDGLLVMVGSAVVVGPGFAVVEVGVTVSSAVLLDSSTTSTT